MSSKLWVAAFAAVVSTSAALAAGPVGSLLDAKYWPANTAIGRITYSEGKVLLHTANGTLPVRQGSVLSAGSELITAANGGAQWWTEDDAIFAAVGLTQFGLDQFEKDHRITAYTLTHGAVRSILGLAPQRLQTPVSELMVPKGTDYAAFLCEGSCEMKTKGLFVTVFSGEMTMRNPVGELQLAPGQIGYVASANSMPTLVVTAPAVYLKTIDQLRFNSTTYEGHVNTDNRTDQPPVQLPPVEPPVSPS
jgi:hypothetical protein